MPYKDEEIRKAKQRVISAAHYQRKKEAKLLAGHQPRVPQTDEARRKYHREWNKKDRIQNPDKQKAVLKKSFEKHKDIRTEEKRRYERDNPDKLREFRRRTRYGVTPEMYESMVREQSNQCAICKLEVPLVVDHCHSTLRVRGLLCKTCNAGLGMFRDNPVWLRNAAAYIKD